MARSKRDRVIPWITALVGGVALVGVGTVAVLGWPYYTAAPADRIFFPEHRLFGAAGRIGLWLGVLAGALFLFNLLYLARKKVHALEVTGSMRSWLDAHVLTGILGALLVPLHSALEVKSLVTKTCIWSLVVVVVTGLLGRYMIRFIPRTRAGDPMSTAAVEAEVMAFIDEVRPKALHDAEAVRVLQRIADAASAKRRPALTFSESRARLRQVRADMRYLKTVAAGTSGSGDDIFELDFILKRVQGIYKQTAASDFASRLMDSWRIFHGVLALLFVVALGVHVGVAIYYGYVKF
ncbi:MAG: hypothetical protein IT371_05635 [Deltaproteobacteria bacterium]|nr:hypothetical protein [Deltaproteobacteria bacterium]